MRALGLDTSNYTTSAAVFDGAGGRNAGKLLEVKAGTLGLRQSEALFQHVKALPDRVAELKEGGLLEGVAAVAASTRPRAVEGSYMPCFLAGESLGRSLAHTLNVPSLQFPTSRATWRLPPGRRVAWSFWTGPSWPGISPGAPPSFFWWNPTGST